MKKSKSKIIILISSIVVFLLAAGLCFYLFKNSTSTTPQYSIGLEYEFNKSNKTCSVKKIGSCKDKDIIIPSSIDGYEVTRIGSYAFYKCETIISVIIPDSVTRIEDEAFNQCN